MAVPRLPFLYPQLFKQLRTPDLQIGLCPLSVPPTVKRARQFHHGRRQRQESFAQRYGPAAEPAIPPQLPQKPEDSRSVPSPAEDTSPPTRKKDEVKINSASSREVSAPKLARKPVSATPPPEKGNAKIQGSEKRDADESHLKAVVQSPRVDTSKPLETVLHLEAPTSKKLEEHQLPHLHAPPYVHHFDTYSLVKDLEKGNFTEDQSITLMKAVRGLLAVNLDVAKEGLVSKSDVENVYRDDGFPLQPRTVADSACRRLICSARHARNYAQRCKMLENLPARRCEQNVLTCSTSWIF